jgi:hypothetical protein
MDDRIRVFFAERDTDNRSFIRFVDLDINDPTKLLGEPSGRVLENGLPGTFDHFGQMPSSVLGAGQNLNLYYSGWNALENGSYHNASGVAVSQDGGQTFRRAVDGPILDRTPDEPYLAVTPSHCAGLTYYVSGLRWERIYGRYEPIYAIHAARSEDGLHYERLGQVIPQLHENECFSRPWVMRIDAGWHMWYSHRSAFDYRDGQHSYRIGYAMSTDGLNWTRADALFNLERSDWDAKMQCYPAVFYAKGKLWMLFNGNTFGREGFGLAVCDGN